MPKEKVNYQEVYDLYRLCDHLIEFFHLLEVEDDTIWENDRNEFF